MVLNCKNASSNLSQLTFASVCVCAYRTWQSEFGLLNICCAVQKKNIFDLMEIMKLFIIGPPGVCGVFFMFWKIVQ